MKKVAVFTALVLVALMGYVLYTFLSTGFFREIDNQFLGSWEDIHLPGVEDIQVDREAGFAILSSDDRAAHRNDRRRKGDLYYLDLKQDNFSPILLTEGLSVPFYPHGISMIRLDNGRYKLYAINHVREQHSIEVFVLAGTELTHVETLRDPSMISPNDIVAVDANRFYFTNDHGYTSGWKRLGEEYLGWAVSNVVYHDGADYREVAEGIAYANGINMDIDRNLLFVASPRAFQVNVYETQAEGDLAFVEDIPCGTGVDNIELDKDGKLLIGCHPSLLHFTAYASGRKETSPSEVITIDYRSKGDYEVNSIFTDTGENMTSSTVAAAYKDLVLVGNVMDDHFLILRRD